MWSVDSCSVPSRRTHYGPVVADMNMSFMMMYEHMHTSQCSTAAPPSRRRASGPRSRCTPIRSRAGDNLGGAVRSLGPLARGVVDGEGGLKHVGGNSENNPRAMPP